MTHPFSVGGIDHLVLRAVDAPRAIAFYRDVLGCAVERQSMQYRLTQLRAGTALIDVLDVPGDDADRGLSEGRNLDHLAIQVSPFDEPALRRHFAAHDVEVEEVSVNYGARGVTPSLFVRDPEGNLIEVKGGD